MSQFFSIHPDNPQPRLIRQAVEIIRAGGVIVYPTDSCYALGCRVGDKAAMERIRAIREVDARHHFGLLCRDLAEAAVYARIDDRQFRLMKTAMPGSYTFILHATREVPRRLLHPRRKTIGVRIPAHRVVHALLAELGEPLLSSTLMLPGDAAPLDDAREIRDLFRTIPPEDLSRLLRALARFLVFAHNQGILHRDLSDGNLLVRASRPGAYDLFLIDTNRISVRRKVSLPSRVRNLVRLGVPPSYQDDFLRFYLGDRRCGLAIRLWYRLNKHWYRGFVAFKRALRLKRLAERLGIQ